VCEKAEVMKKFMSLFQKSEDGAITVDWVVLTAAVMLLGVAAGATIGSSVETASINVSESITENTTSTP